MTKFTPQDISKIARMTHNNEHGEARLFIAKKINSPLAKTYKSINKAHIDKGYLSQDLNEKRQKADEKLMAELRKKLQFEEYKKVYGSL